MLNPKRLKNIKNNQIQMWRVELGNFYYDMKHLLEKVIWHLTLCREFVQ